MFPQMYVKVKGAWTGGHEENSRYSAINLNHGPSSSTWHCVGPKWVKKFRNTVLKTHRVDIYKNEGLWFCGPDYCFNHGIPCYTIEQKAGDLVVLGTGVEHWVRAHGLATQTAWNFGRYSYS